MVIKPLKNRGLFPEVTPKRLGSMVTNAVIIVPTHTKNITGFLIKWRGFNLTNACLNALE
jgi:hypothetical protein